MVTVVISPGLGNSSPEHWQSYLEQKYQNVIRVEQTDWQNPQRDIWMAQIEKTVSEIPGPIILVGHSCGSVAVTQWAQHYSTERVIGALLVAPADVDADTALPEIKVQRPLPTQPLLFPSLVVSSDNDVHITLARAQWLAAQWGSQFKVLPQAGHINAESGFGDWIQAEQWIEGFFPESVLVPVVADV